METKNNLLFMEPDPDPQKKDVGNYADKSTAGDIEENFSNPHWSVQDQNDHDEYYW